MKIHLKFKTPSTLMESIAHMINECEFRKDHP